MIPKNIIRTFKQKLTYAYRAPAIEGRPTVAFIPGFRSNFITSQKAHAVYAFTEQHQLGFLSWNHVEPGDSVMEWYEDSRNIMHSCGAEYIVSASMGLWISLLLASHDVPLKGILSIGGGVDFTERWLQQQVPVEHRLDAEFVWRKPSKYDESGYYDIHIDFLLKSRPALILDKQLSFKCPKVYLIHGRQDEDVSVQEAIKVRDYLLERGVNVVYCEVKDGDHRLSRSQDLLVVGQKMKQMIF